MAPERAVPYSSPVVAGVLPLPLLILLTLPLAPPGDVLRGRTPTARGTYGDLATLTDGHAAAEGTVWNSPGAVLLRGPESEVVYDLAAPHLLRAMTLQADNDDTYPVDVSDDGKTWRPLWVAAPVPNAPGLRTRGARFERGVVARYLRVRATEGDGRYAISDVRAYCIAPKAPIAPQPPAQTPLLGFLNDERAILLKGWIALAGTLVLLAGHVLTRRGRGNVLRRTRDTALVLLGLFSLAAWWNFGRFHFDDYIHVWDTYHYYIGAKYFPELGYLRIYDATELAEVELGLKSEVTTRRVRNLATNHIEGTERILSEAEPVKAHFTPERWEAFKKDILFFRLMASRGRWDGMLLDHGFNGTPVWVVLGRALASLAPASRTQVFLLSLVDPLLLLAMWGFVTWAFGFRVATVALLYWGTNLPGRFYWNGGAYLRQDWLALLVIGICLLKLGRFATAGAALSASTLLRIFPGAVLVGLGLATGLRMLRERRSRLLPEERRLFVGAAGAAAVLVALSFAAAGGVGAGLSSWVGFVENSEKHVHTPLTNNMGLKTLVAFDMRTRAALSRDETLADPFEPWKEARRASFRGAQVLFVALVLGYLALLSRGVPGREPWEIAALSVGLIFAGAELTCYYYSFLLVVAFLWPVIPLAGVGLTALAAISDFVPSLLYWDDERYTLISALVLVLLFAVTFRIRRRPLPARDLAVSPAEADATPSPQSPSSAPPRRRRRRR